MEELLKTSILIILGATDEEKGDYNLYFSRRLFIDTNGDHDKIIKLLGHDKLDVKPCNENDNHCGLILCYKDEKND